MSTAESLDPALFSRLVDNLYVEAMIMADEARSYFDGPGVDDKDRLDVVVRLSFACESLKVTTRLMHVIAWLLTQKAWRRGEVDSAMLDRDGYRLGEASTSEDDAVSGMPLRARRLVLGSQSLYERVRRLQNSANPVAGQEIAGGKIDAPAAPVASHSPARDLLNRLENSL